MKRVERLAVILTGTAAATIFLIVATAILAHVPHERYVPPCVDHYYATHYSESCGNDQTGQGNDAAEDKP